MRNDTTTTATRYHFDSLGDLARYLDNAPKTWKGNQSSSCVSNTNWDLGAGYSGALKLAFNGWIEGAQRAQEALRAFPPLDPAPRTVTDFFGHRPHVARYCAGAPDNMIRNASPPRADYGQVLTLIVPINAMASVSAHHMANFGIAVAQYVNQLEAERVRVEVIGAMVSSVSRTRLTHSWVVKKADQPLDLAVLAFAIGHPAMFRRLGFGLRERSSVREDRDYGVSVLAELTDIIDAPRNAFVLNGMKEAGQYARTPEAALEYIEAQISTALDDRLNT